MAKAGRTPEPADERLEWCGPTGHRSQTYGDLVPGRTYTVPADRVAYYLTLTKFWKRPGLPAPAPDTAEE